MQILTIQGMIDEDFAGGVARVNNGTIENCTINADVTGTSTIGGMVAVNQRGTIKGCAVTGDVTTSATSATVGGIVSTIANTSIDACYYSGEVQTGEYGRVNNYGTEVDSWTDEEIKDMNTYLTDCEYEFALNKEKQPVLVKKGSAEQAVNRLLGHFWG